MIVGVCKNTFPGERRDVPPLYAPEDHAEANEVTVTNAQVSKIRDFVDAVEAADEFVDSGFVGFDPAFEAFALVVAERGPLESLLGLDDLTDTLTDPLGVTTLRSGFGKFDRQTRQVCIAVRVPSAMKSCCDLFQKRVEAPAIQEASKASAQ